MEPTPKGPAFGSVLLPGQSDQDSPQTLGARAHPRFDLPEGTTCRLTTITGHECMTVQIVNVSRGGLGMLAEMPLARGTCLLAELASRSGLFARVLLTHIIHVQQEEDGRFTMGGEFLEPLSADELRLFLG
jgi:hypothetical protein